MRHYGFNVIWSEDDEAFVATCSAFPSLSAFGDTPAEAIAEAEVVLSLFIEEYEEEGVPLPMPDTLATYSGRTLVRMPKTLHAQLAACAESEGTSLNAIMVYFLTIGVSSASARVIVREQIDELLNQISLVTERRVTDFIHEAFTFSAANEAGPQDHILRAIEARGSGD